MKPKIVLFPVTVCPRCHILKGPGMKCVEYIFLLSCIPFLNGFGMMR